ncbi:MAG: FAD:protein FMN transferase [Ruminococcaceae bacterium]|nr:FAD:protein FMN transferase [Oscillospiraceae bacterium]
MNKQRSISTILLVFILFSYLSLPSCGTKKTKYIAQSLDYFDTATTITGYEKDKAAFDRTSGKILDLLCEYHRLFDIYHRYDGMENLYTVNGLKNGVHRVVKVDSRIIDMLLYAKEMHRVTEGKLNIAMGSVLSIWHDYRTAASEHPSDAKLPPKELLDEAAEHTDIDSLVIDRENSTVWISDPQTTLDVGAVAKGYAVEMVARELEAKGISGYVINVGGNVRTVGVKPDGNGWLVGIENPKLESDEPYVEYLQLAGESVVTSGLYQRYYTVDGKNYHHIIDPQTLLPAEGYLSVSVVCNNSADGDCLSTALFCMSFDQGLALVDSLDGVDALWIMSDGSKRYSSGFEKYTTAP